MVESDVLTYIEDNFPEFLQTIRYLSKEDQELLLGYYVLAKTQTSLALLHRSTQTLCSARIRLAMQKMGTYLIMGPPTPELMQEHFDVTVPVEDADGTKEIALENLLAVPLSQVVELYSRTRSFQRVAEVLSLHRPEVRRVMTLATKVLSESEDRHKKAIGAYLFDLIDKASASGAGFSRRKMEKQGNIIVTTPSIFGNFRVDVTDEAWGQMFASRANR